MDPSTPPERALDSFHLELWTIGGCYSRLIAEDWESDAERDAWQELFVHRAERLDDLVRRNPQLVAAAAAKGGGHSRSWR